MLGRLASAPCSATPKPPAAASETEAKPQAVGSPEIFELLYPRAISPVSPRPGIRQIACFRHQRQVRSKLITRGPVQNSSLIPPEEVPGGAVAIIADAAGLVVIGQAGAQRPFLVIDGEVERMFGLEAQRCALSRLGDVGL